MQCWTLAKTSTPTATANTVRTVQTNTHTQVEATNGDKEKGVALLTSKYVDFFHTVAREMADTGPR